MAGRTATQSARCRPRRRTAGYTAGRRGQAWSPDLPTPARRMQAEPGTSSLHRSFVDGRIRGIGRQEGDRLAGVIDRPDFLADLGGGADVHAETIIGANEVGDRLAVVVRPLRRNQLRRIVRVSGGPFAG